MSILALTTHDMLVWILCVCCILLSFLITLLGDDIGEPWATLLLWGLVLGCALLAGMR